MKARDMVWIFLLCRLILLISLPLEGLRGFGDALHFYTLAGMGSPFLDYWVEFPPIFPYISRLLFLLAGGVQHIYDYLLVLLMTLAQGGSLWLFVRLAHKLHAQSPAQARAWGYFAITLCLPYGWWYFDALAVLAMLAALDWISDQKDIRAGFAIALGALTKLFPLLLLPMAWRWLGGRKAWKVILLAVGLTLAVYAALYLRSPQLTQASLRSQGAKGSWETVWALLDGNLNTGNFGPEAERLDPATASLRRGNPAVLPAWLTLIPFALLGGWFFLRARLHTTMAALAFLGLTWCIFLLWSPGYSPQWVLYLLPLILLAIPQRQAILVSLILVFINVLEWPVLLSRGYNWGLWMTVPARTLLLGVILHEFWKIIPTSSQNVEAR